jgi:phage-related protein
MTNKPICWMGSSLEDLSDFPESARRKAGFQLRLIQGGEEPSDFKPMSIVGSGVEEIGSERMTLIEFFMSHDLRRRFMFSMHLGKRLRRLQS